jgi:glycosyltransferase involved in cell wall biosynthesis
MPEGLDFVTRRMKAAMRVDLIITELDMGGAEQCLVRLAKYLRGNELTSQDWRVRVIALGPPPQSPKDGLVLELADAQVPIHFLNGRTWRDFPKIVRGMRKLLRSDPPDIAQAFLFHANILSAWCYPSFGIPWVGGYRVAEPRRWRYPLERWASRRMAKGVCVSNSVAAWCRSQVGIVPELLEVIPNGVSPSAWHSLSGRSQQLEGEEMRLRREFSIPERAPLMTFVGRLTPQKGVDCLLQSLPSILEQLPEFHAVIVGDGEGRSRLDSLIRSQCANGGSTRIHSVGWSHQPRLWMAISEMLLLPSRYEGMANVLLEAMSEGISLATLEVEGVREILGENAEQPLAAAGDWDDWCRVVVELGSQPELRRRIGEANRHRAAEFQWERFLARYEDLYRSLKP